jgi:UDP-glucose 4-epimerase
VRNARGRVDVLGRDWLVREGRWLQHRGKLQRAVVTGGAGFIGSHLIRSLSHDGLDVLVLDSSAEAMARNAEPLVDSARLELVVGDIRRREVLDRVVRFQADIVFHLAALHFIPSCAAHPDETWSVNVVGTETLLRGLRVAPPRVVVLASSAAVYGFSNLARREEDASAPTDVYGRTKVRCEELLADFAAIEGETRCVAARLFNVYGPNDTTPHIIPMIITAAAQGTTMRIGNLWPKRDYVFVPDAAEALTRIAAGGPGFDVFNVGTGVPRSVLDLVRAVEGLSGKRVDLISDPDRVRENDGHLFADCGKLHEATNWEPRIQLEQGLQELVSAPLCV